MSDIQKYMEMIGSAIIECIAFDGYAEVVVNNKSLGIVRLNSVNGQYGKSILADALPDIKDYANKPAA